MPASIETIKVFIRFKGKEVIPEEEKDYWQFPRETEIVAPELDSGTNNEQVNGGKFTFDKVLLETSQEEMYKMAAKDTVKQFTNGYNGTIFAYGQSGSGKTFTMLGPEEVIEFIKSGKQISEDLQNLYGIIPRAIRDFFEYMNTEIEQEGAQFQVFMNYFEIYKESLNNLIGTSNATS